MDGEWTQEPCDSGACVQVRETEFGNVIMRSSADISSAVFLTKAEFQAFAQGIRNGTFDEFL